MVTLLSPFTFTVVHILPTAQVEIASVLHRRHQVAICEIAVLTPYSAQMKKIKMIVQKERGDLKNLQVHTINESQGIDRLYSFI